MVGTIIPSSQFPTKFSLLYLRIDIEERLDALLQLRLDLFLAALQQMQRDVLFASVPQLDLARAHLLQFTLRAAASTRTPAID